jgi:hypothetical protein
VTPSCLALLAALAAADPLEDVNAAFRDAYARARAETLRQGGPVLVYQGDSLVLLRDGKRTEVRVVPPGYHDLKAVAHVPLLVYALLAPFGEGEIGPERKAALADVQKRLAAVEPALAERGFSEEALKRQRAILTLSSEMLVHVRKEGRATSAAVRDFCRKAAPLVLDNVADAARLQLDGLHRQATAWKKELSPEEWRRLRVVVIGSALPRKDNVAVQYFARLLGVPGEGPRLVYAESLWDEAKAVNLLGTHELDTAIGSAFFADPKRMHRDLLAAAAAEHLKRLKFDGD